MLRIIAQMLKMSITIVRFPLRHINDVGSIY